MNRKTFLRNSSMAALALAYNPPSTHAGPTATKVRLAVIGTGLRGQSHLSLLMRRDDVEIIAICDIDDYMLTRAKDIISKAGRRLPAVYTGDPYAWKDLLKKEQPDGVLIATPWEWHKDMV